MRARDADSSTPETLPIWQRRRFVAALLGGAVAGRAAAQDISPEPTRRDWSGQAPLPYPDPDLVALDPRFQSYILFNTPIQRLYTGTLWAEGPAWNGVGRYLVWSDIPSNRQLRFIGDDGRVTTFRNPSGFSNGNSFDYQGRQLSCEHGGRRVARYEPDGTVTTVADRFEGRRLNSPNDVVVHPDGSIWFTDPSYGIRGDSAGASRRSARARRSSAVGWVGDGTPGSSPDGSTDPSYGIRGDYEGARAESETKEAVYRVDPASGRVAMVTDEVGQPNGLCFSPDYSRLYIADTGAPRDIKVGDVDGARLRNLRQLTTLVVPGTNRASAADGMRCDADGNIWAGARPGVQVIAPDGEAIGMIRLPEVCANVCFGGARRNRLFMTASQSLYAVYVGVRGAHIA